MVPPLRCMSLGKTLLAYHYNNNVCNWPILLYILTGSCVCSDCFMLDGQGQCSSTLCIDYQYNNGSGVCLPDNRPSQLTAFLLSLFLSSTGAANFFIGQDGLGKFLNQCRIIYCTYIHIIILSLLFQWTSSNPSSHRTSQTGLITGVVSSLGGFALQSIPKNNLS